MSKWTQEEIDYLIEHQGKQTYKVIGNILDRSEASVANQAKRLGIADKKNCIRGKAWSEKELQYMQDNYGKLSNKQIAKKLNRSPDSIQDKAQRMGLTNVRESESIPWTEEDIMYLEKYYERRGADYVAKHVKRTVHAVRRKAQELGLNAWATEDLYIRTMATCFNCDSSVINRWINDFGLPAFTVQRGQLKCKLIAVKDFWKWAEFHKEIIPWEKYEKGSVLPEPKWLPKTIKEYSVQNNRKRISYWDVRTVVKMKQEGYTDKEIAENLNRTLSSVKHIWRQVKEDNAYGTNNR